MNPASTEMTDMRQQLYHDMAPLHLTPLWKVLHALVPPQPNSPYQPALWKYEEVQPLILKIPLILSKKTS